MEFRLPNITGRTEREMLLQIKSYLYQLVGDLQFAVNNLDGTTSSVVVNTPKTVSNATTGGNAQASFESIKSLIIKSADIVDAYYDEISKMLVGEYVAQSDFGTYSEDTAQVIIENSTEIERLFANIQKISTDIEQVEYKLIDANAHIRSGLLYYESGVPVYGLEIGQRNVIDGEEVFNKYARFTSDRLSFYDQNDSEVAYISDYKLYIRNVEITSSYKIGGFVDYVQSNGDVVTKWVGGAG